MIKLILMCQSGALEIPISKFVNKAMKFIEALI